MSPPPVFVRPSKAEPFSITVTLLPLPISHIKNPSSWTYVMHGNVVITIGLFLTRWA